MEVGKVNNSPNFGARIIIQKTGFKNLGKDIVNTVELGSKTTESVSSAVTESTIFPSDATRNFPVGRRMVQFIEEGFNKLFNKILNRNIKTSAIEGIDVKAAASNSAVASAGAGSISTGLESYDYAFASALDQSIHYPNSSYPANAAEFIGNHLPQSIAEHYAEKVNSVYKQIWDPRNSAGNELASCASTTYSGLGAIAQGFGFDLLTKSKKAFTNVEDIQRKLPS